MRIINLNDSVPTGLLPSVATIGLFDGVHCGHRYLIRHVVEEARASSMQSMVITFDCPPRQVIQSDWHPQLLCTSSRKLELLSGTSIDSVSILHFDKAMAQLSARTFMEEVLQRQLNVRKLVIGYDNRFGHNRSEGFEDYVRYGREIGIEVVRHHAFSVDGETVSSSLVRRLIKEGEVKRASECLGYHYQLCGRVVGGYQEGRKLGFPTANITVTDDNLLIPAAGVYAVMACCSGSDELRPAMMNIGTRPTYGGTGLSLEVNIFDFHEDLYDKELSVLFLQRIREERTFGSPAELREQLMADRDQIRQLIEQDSKQNNIRKR